MVTANSQNPLFRTGPSMDAGSDCFASAFNENVVGRQPFDNGNH
ncbi:hypothetical protein R52603_00455 [Paraburkholderia saeva]|uniref:Uncharacterized protein n=1 Tax=Paraburkholderia saeva TaxID=2777537 RepID=A0A9N8RWC6_9BURK|nr:hypothetical protein R52603_00455 [Paraburkholderia saeva]CAG4895137.1 hypothetical protein LMG31841_02076 [Paraburkholderia saeva]CAG4897880.1 hypothetical protein R70241_02389 [Paraburkholderia saeva]